MRVRKAIRYFVCCFIAGLAFTVAVMPSAFAKELFCYKYESDTATNVVDTSGSGNNGKILDSSTLGFTYVDGKFGKAVQLDGATQYIETPDVWWTLKDFTFATWFRWEGGKAWQRLLDIGDDCMTGSLFITPLDDNKYLRVNFYDPTTKAAFSAETSAVKQNEWYHLAITVSNGTFVLYINGQPATIIVSNAPAGGKATAYNKVKSAPCAIDMPTLLNTIKNWSDADTKGKYWNRIGAPTNVWDVPFMGSLDSTRLYDTALTAAQITQLYTTDAITESATSTPGTTTSAATPGGDNSKNSSKSSGGQTTSKGASATAQSSSATVTTSGTVSSENSQDAIQSESTGSQSDVSTAANHVQKSGSPLIPIIIVVCVAAVLGGGGFCVWKFVLKK